MLLISKALLILANHNGLSEKQLLAPQAHKKFEAELSNQIWQGDMLFGPLSTMRRFIARRNWRALPPHLVFWSCTPDRINLKVAARLKGPSAP
jgi:hypothetical protein